MKNEITKTPENLHEIGKIVSSELSKLSKDDKVQALYSFNTLINRQPSKTWIKSNNNIDYLPIRVVESLLSSVYGVYQIEMAGSPQLIGNSIVVSVHLNVFHPVLQQFIKYAGVGAVPVQLSRNSKPMQIENLLGTAIQKNAPAAKSFAVSNAAKSIGPLFGSDLNSEEDNMLYDVHKVLEQKIKLVHNSNLFNDLKDQLYKREIQLEYVFHNYDMDIQSEEEFKSIELETSM